MIRSVFGVYFLCAFFYVCYNFHGVGQQSSSTRHLQLCHNFKWLVGWLVSSSANRTILSSLSGSHLWCVCFYVCEFVNFGGVGYQLSSVIFNCIVVLSNIANLV